MTEPKSREQLEKEWWDAWWAADYSWAGLAKHKIGGEGGLFGEKTLQDYWRRDPATGVVRDDAAMRAASELVDLDGATFHIAHMPVKLRGGGATWKGDPLHTEWMRLESLIHERVSKAVETQTDWKFDAKGLDGRAQLAGAVLRTAVAHPLGIQHQLHLDCRSSAFLAPAIFGKVVFGPGTRFDGAIFSGYAWFVGATFSGDACFQRAFFSGDVTFEDSIFFGVAGFPSTFMHGVARFQRVTFRDDTWFESATFSGDADFHRVNFAHHAGFERAAFSGNAEFGNVTFSGDTTFEGATFSDCAEFKEAIFCKQAEFPAATFSGFATFENATFFGDACFGVGSGEGGGQMTFTGAIFHGGADFRTWVFAGLTYFDNAQFLGDIDFGAAVFEKLASFERILWPDDARHWHSAFDQTLFRGTASFTGAGFMSYAAFDGATFERGVQIDDATERASKQQFLMEKAAAIAAAKADGAAFETEETEKRKEKGERVSRGEIARYVARQREERLKQLERGCRVLKQAMERASNKSREQLLYRFELQARRAQRGLPPGEALFSDLYGATSDYGASMVRPFVTLALLIAAFSALFFATASALGMVGDGEGQVGAVAAWLQAFDLSWANVFKPLSALTAGGTAEGSLGEKLLGHSPLIGSALRVAATVQSLFAIVLAFLFALAVRRRFQIS